MEDNSSLQEAGFSTTKFNFGVAMTEVLRNFLTNIELSFIQWDLRTALELLGAVHNEVDYLTGTEEKEDISQIFEELKNITDQYPYVLDSTDENYSPKLARLQARNILIRYNRLLRRIIHDNGLGMPKKGESSLF